MEIDTRERERERERERQKNISKDGGRNFALGTFSIRWSFGVCVVTSRKGKLADPTQ